MITQETGRESMPGKFTALPNGAAFMPGDTGRNTEAREKTEGNTQGEMGPGSNTAWQLLRVPAVSFHS